MRIRFRTVGKDRERTLRSWVERRFRRALGPLAPSVRALDVRLEDVEGAESGWTAACSIEAFLRPSGRVLVFQAGRDAQEAVERAVDRAASAVRASLDRRIGSSAPAPLPGG